MIINNPPGSKSVSESSKMIFCSSSSSKESRWGAGKPTATTHTAELDQMVDLLNQASVLSCPLLAAL